MSSALYNREILRLAASLDGPRRLDQPEGSADRRSPTCGSRVIVDVRLDDAGCVDEIALQVSACALGQASAALMRASVVGRSVEELRAAAEALRAYLTQPDAPEESDFWPGIAVFGPARSYPARHPSILLAFEAVSEAAARAEQARTRPATTGRGQ